MTGSVCPRCCDPCAPGAAFCAACGTKIRRACTQCAAEWPAEYAFCAACGTKLGLECPKCESEWPAEYAFCGKCGTQLQAGATPTPVAKAAPAPAKKPAPVAKARAARAKPQPKSAPRPAAKPAAKKSAPAKPKPAAKKPAPKTTAPAPKPQKQEPKPEPASAAPEAEAPSEAKSEPAKPKVEIKEAPQTAEAKAAAKVATDDPALAPGHEAVREGRIDEARETFEQVIASAKKNEDPASKALLAAALSGMAKVYLRSSEFDKLLECGQTLTATAVGPAQQAIGERWTAVAHWRLGQTTEATAHFEAAAEAAKSAGSQGREVLAEALCSHAHLLCDAGRMGEAKKRIRAARRVLRSSRGASIVGIEADHVEGGIARLEGRLVDALQLFSSAYAAARQLGARRQYADAAVSLGQVRYLMGDYERAEHPLEQAVEIGKELGDARIVGHAAMMLSGLALAQGDLPAAREHVEGALAGWEASADARGVALARANLALLSAEEEDWPAVMADAEKALELLAGGVNEHLRGRVLSILGDAQFLTGDIEGARSSYETVTASFDAESSPRVVALAWAGLGRIALKDSDVDGACSWLRRAVDALALAKEEAESAGVRLDLAEALLAADDREGARHELSRARDQFEHLKPKQAQIERLEALEAQVGG